MNKDKLVQLLATYNITPRKEQGQNFLINEEALEASLQAAELTPEDTVLEIGPGFGALTAKLTEVAGRVIAVEQDLVLSSALQPLVTKNDNLVLINEDIRTFHRAEAGLTHLNYKLVANLPYSLTSWIMREFTEYEPKPSRIVTMVQKEVAERIVAPRGKMSILAVAMQLYSDPQIVTIVDRTSFHPIPNVDSAIIRADILPNPRSKDPKQLMRLVKIAFAGKRKQIHNTIGQALPISPTQIRIILSDIGLPETTRPQELGLEDWEALRVAIFQELGV